MDIEKKDLLIRMWATPNPTAWKFVLNCPLKNRGRAEFYSKDDCLNLPLFHSLFDIQGVKQIFVFQNQMTVTHDGSLNEEDMEKQVKSVVETRIVRHDPDFVISSEENNPSEEGIKKEPPSPEVLKVDKILDRTLRPALRADGGDIEVLSVENNEVRISYKGACGGCPSAFMGTLEAIENILQNEMESTHLKVIPV